MRRLKNKSIIMIISMLLLFVGAFTWLTFSLSRADEKDSEDQPPAAGATVKTNIDLIIENSNDTEKEDEFRKYHIVEISSGSPRFFNQFCQLHGSETKTQFEKLVLNGHKSSATQDFCEGFIDYKSFNLETLRNGATDATVIENNFQPLYEAVVNADLIYISCDIGDNCDSDTSLFSKKNDFTKKLSTVLGNYVKNELKPVIIDSPTKVADDVFGTSKTFTYIGAAFGEYGSSRNTFAWNYDSTANPKDPDNPKEPLDPANGMLYFTRSQPSKYLPINGADVEADKWIRVEYDGKEYNAAKILTVKADGGNQPITDKVMEGLGSKVNVTEVGGTTTYSAQRIYAGVDVGEEELIEEDPDDPYDIYNPISTLTGEKANLTITAEFTGNDDASYNPTVDVRLYLLDNNRNIVTSDLSIAGDTNKLSYDAAKHAYIITLNKSNPSITLSDIPVEYIYSIVTTKDDISDSDTYDVEDNKAYITYKTLAAGDNAVNLKYAYMLDRGIIQYGVQYDTDVIEPGVRYFYFALFDDPQGELRTPGYNVREARLGNGGKDSEVFEWDGLPYGNYYVLETDSSGNALSGHLGSPMVLTVDSTHKILAPLRVLNGNAFASDVKISFTINELGINPDKVPAFQFKIRLRDERGKLVNGTLPAVLTNGSTDTNINITFKNGEAVSTIGTEEVEAIEIPYQAYLTITIPDQYRYKITEVNPVKQFPKDNLHYRYNAGNFNDYILAETANAEYVFENDYIESYGSALFYAYKIYQQHPDFVIHDEILYDAKNDAKNFKNVTLEDYDLIIFEGNLESVLLATGKGTQPDDYNTLRTYMKNKTTNGYYNHIIYASNLAPEDGKGGYTFDGAENFMEFYNSLMIKTDVPNGQYSVLLTSPKEMKEILVTNPSTQSVDEIAELINKGRYRFSGGKADVTNSYRVLEIQPCYPIDLQLAATLKRNKKNDDSEWVYEKRRTNSSGYYYLDYDNVLNGYTTDEIDDLSSAYTYVEEEYEEGLGTFHTGIVESPGHIEYPAGTVFYVGPNTTNHYNDTKIGSLTVDGVTYDKYQLNGSAWCDNIYFETEVEDTVTKKGIVKKLTGTSSVDYYDWEVSPAKILHILKQSEKFKDFEIDNIEVVHMSTEEFVCSKESLLDNYDMVYIGGNNSAIKDLNFFVANSTGANSGNHNIGGVDGATYYNMYFHNGDLFKYSQYVKGYENNSYGVQLGNDLTLSKYEELLNYANNDMPIIVSSTLAKAFNSSNGSYEKHQIDPDSRMYLLLNTIKSYDSVGFGVNTISTVATDVGELDGVDYVPDSHTLYSGFITLYNKDAEVTIKNLIDNHGSRPKYQITYAPTIYNLYDKSTTLTTRDLNFEFSIQNVDDLIKAGHEFTAYLYLDDNGDSRFDVDKEEVDSKPGQLGKAEHTVPDDFFGSVYLQLTIADKYTGKNGKQYEQRSSQRFLCKIDPPSGDKDRINILQILPDGGQLLNGLKATKGSQLDTLFFCTECQLCGGILEGGTRAGGNGIDNASLFKRDGSGKLEPALGDDTIKTLMGGSVSDVETIKNNIQTYERANGDTSYTLLVNGLGAHTHIFGIPEYKALHDSPEWEEALGAGSYPGVDDYNANLADYIADDYDFNMDILETTEFNNLVVKIAGEYNGLTSAEVKSLRAQHVNSRAEYEQYYDILNNLMSSDLKEKVGDTEVQYKYHSAVLSKINTEYSAITLDAGGEPEIGVNVLRDLRDQLKIFYNNNGITWTSNDTTFENMTLRGKYDHVGAIIDTASRNAGIAFNQTEADNFYTYLLNKYGYSDLDMQNFESQMYDLGAKVSDIRDFVSSGYNIDKYIEDTVYPMLNTAEAGGNTVFGGKTVPLVRQYFRQIVNHKAYADYYSLQNATNSANWSGTLEDYTALFKKWRNAGIYRKYLLYKYTNEAKLASISDDGKKVDLTSVYSIIIVGPADDFNGRDMKDPSTAAIQNYIDNDGRVLLFYDTINVNIKGNNPSEVTADGTDMAENLTADLRKTFGQDARHADELKIGKFPNEQYYISTLSTKDTKKVNNSWKLKTDAITDRSIVFGQNKGQADAGFMDAYMYKYAAYLYFEEGDNTRFESHHYSNNETWKRSVTDRASRNNEGILTKYPFPLDPVLNITATNPQGYNLDIEDDDMTVYYTLSGGTAAPRNESSGEDPMSTNSSLMAATPNDGADNYFIYQYKNVTYCGAGNSVVTGLGTDNNDERMLFINIIVNSLRKSAIGTQVKLYDALKTDPNTGSVANPMANAKVKPTGTGLYEIEAKSMTDSPEFSFYIKTDKNVSITRVTAYYDLDLAMGNGNIIALTNSHPYDTDTFADYSTNVKHQNASGEALPEHVLIYDTGDEMANLRDADKDINKKQRNVNLGIVKDITKNSDGTYSSYNAGLQGVTYGVSSNGNAYAAGCNLELREDYFKPYDGAYTFITVRVETKDAKGRDLAPIYRRIKVVLPYDLFDLN